MSDDHVMHSVTSTVEKEMSRKKRAPDHLTLEILCDFRGLLSARDGDRLRGIIRFGSRARGDFREESDANLAVFIDPESDPVGAQMDISGDVYLTFLDRGLLSPGSFKDHRKPLTAHVPVISWTWYLPRGLGYDQIWLTESLDIGVIVLQRPHHWFFSIRHLIRLGLVLLPDCDGLLA